MNVQEHKQTDEERLRLIPDALLGYAKDVEKYGRPIDSGLPSALRFVATRIGLLNAAEEVLRDIRERLEHSGTDERCRKELHEVLDCYWNHKKAKK